MNENVYNSGVVGRVLELIRDARGRPITEDEMALQAGYTVRHIRRVFSAAMGESPGEYEHRLRMEAAANLLSGGTDPVKCVAQQAHYDSLSSFCRSFRNQFDSTPSNYRRLNSSPEHLLPAYEALLGERYYGEHVEVGNLTTMLYDQARHHGRLHPDGHIELPGGRVGPECGTRDDHHHQIRAEKR